MYVSWGGDRSPSKTGGQYDVSAMIAAWSGKVTAKGGERCSVLFGAATAASLYSSGKSVVTVCGRRAYSALLHAQRSFGCYCSPVPDIQYAVLALDDIHGDDDADSDDDDGGGDDDAGREDAASVVEGEDDGDNIY